MKMRRFVLAGFLAASGLVPGVASAQISPAPAACPPGRVEVVKSRGGDIKYVGTVANVPDLCRQIRSDGPGDYYYGIWRVDWPGAGQAYPAIKNVVMGDAGTRVDFVTYSVPGQQFVDSFINEGLVPMVVDGKTYQTLRLAHERKGFDGNTYHSVITSWRDVRTGIGLRTEERQISGKSYGPNTTWQAVRVEALPQ